MSSNEKIFLAIAPTPQQTLAVLSGNGKVMDRFSTPIRGAAALDQICDLLYYRFYEADCFSNVILTGYDGDPWPENIEDLLEKQPGIFYFDILHGAAVRAILTMDTWLCEDPAFRRLELITHLCSLRHQRKSLEHPGKALLEWALNRAREQAIEFEKKLQNERNHIVILDEVLTGDELPF